MPPHAHEHVELSSRAGLPSTVTLEDPGDHGVSTGWHGCGLSVPLAAAVALATVGLDMEVHIPNDAMFAASMSATVPTAAWLPLTSGLEALNVAGVVPNTHWRDAPVQTRLDTSAQLVLR